MCELATVSRASFYRHWEEKTPTEAEMALRDVIQRMAIGHRFYGYRLITVLAQREGYEVGTKKVRRLISASVAVLSSQCRQKLARLTLASSHIRWMLNPPCACIHPRIPA